LTNRYLIIISFKGTCYHGWQIQENAITVQFMLEQALYKITGESIKTTGAGRTDAGVHAKFFSLHINSRHELFNYASIFLYKINSVLPEDISVLGLHEVGSEFHARFSALSRIYEYRLCRNKDPFLIDFAWRYERDLDINRMNEAASLLCKYDDFTSFSKLHSNTKTNYCKVFYASWREDGSSMVFKIKADRFLRNMVRAIVGTLIEVGRGKINIMQFREIIESKDRGKAKYSAPAKGLFLTSVEYPQSITEIISCNNSKINRFPF